MTQPAQSTRPSPATGTRLSPADAGAALARGELVILPTDTVFGLAARATDRDSVDRLWAARGTSDAQRAPLAWHMPDTATLQRTLADLANGSVHPVHKRLVERLTPGPVMFAIPTPEDRLADVLRRNGVVPGAMDDSRELLARVPNHAASQEALRVAGVPVVITSLPGTGPHPARGSNEAWAQFERHAASTIGVAGYVADAPAPSGRSSTLIRLTPGSYQVVREGAFEERFIAKRLTRNLLFVCTGNTCRSPMAEAIARAALAKRSPAIPVGVRSAGVYASPGSPATPEAIAALRSMGVDMHRHSSTPLSREMLADADIVFTLTQGHRQSVLALEPGAEKRVLVLDPDGDDVPDPIGQSQDAYDRTARRIQELVNQRLDELNW